MSLRFRFIAFVIIVSSSQLAFSGLLCKDLFTSSELFASAIDYRQISQVRRLKSDQGTADILSGIYNQKNVVIKFRDNSIYSEFSESKHQEMVQRAFKSLTKEAYWYEWLNKQGVGVKFIGFTYVRGELGLVIERIPKPNMILKEPNDFDEVSDYQKQLKQSRVSISENTIKELDRVIDILIAHDIMAYDLQFLIGQNGQLTLIDPEGFQYHQSTDRYNARELGERQRLNFKRILEALMQK